MENTEKESSKLIPLDKDKVTEFLIDYPCTEAEYYAKEFCSRFGVQAIPSVSLFDIKDTIHRVLCQLLVDDRPDRFGIRKSDTIGERVHSLLSKGVKND